MKDYKVVPAMMKGEMRYVVQDLDGNVIDDMNGNGYHNKTTAHRGFNYKRKHDMI